MAKRHQRHAAPPRQTRTRTRQNKGAALVSDPIQNTQQLNNQLSALGLYAAPTLGDGNCLFRALSDQYYGSPSQHFKLREQICDWMAAHKQRYAPFVDDERGLDVHLECMRQSGTYGGHLELTAFAHLKRRDVKVIQPGLVYVIEWTSGADLSPTTSETPMSEQIPSASETPLNTRDARRARREKKKELEGKTKTTKHQQRLANDVYDDTDDGSSSLGAVYVAYHDWEHFSSVRNLIGPHSGLPYTVEKLATSQSASQSASSKAKGKALSPQSSQSSILSSAVEDELNDEEHGLPSPTDTPLPISRSSSLSPSSETSASTSAPSSSLSVPPLPGYNRPLDTGQSKPGSNSKRLSLRMNHSPKRAYNGTDEAAEDSQGEAKRSRSVRHASGSRVQAKANKEVDAADNDPDADTPELLSSGESSSVASSPAATPPPSMVVVPPSPVTRAKPLTRRQRKALGLPGPRSELGKNGKSAGKIVVPGGRFRNSSSAPVSTKTDAGEWTKNGTGRVDVRGFKELKI